MNKPRVVLLSMAAMSLAACGDVASSGESQPGSSSASGSQTASASSESAPGSSSQSYSFDKSEGEGYPTSMFDGIDPAYTNLHARTDGVVDPYRDLCSAEDRASWDSLDAAAAKAEFTDRYGLNVDWRRYFYSASPDSLFFPIIPPTSTISCSPTSRSWRARPRRASSSGTPTTR